MNRFRTFSLVIIFLTVSVVRGQGGMIHVLDDYDDQDYFTHLSGDWNKWGHVEDTFTLAFDHAHARGGAGACLQVDYEVPPGNYGGIWISMLGKDNFPNYALDFTDLYGPLKNSTGHPCAVENVHVLAVRFWARGAGLGTYNHVVRVEVKDVDDAIVFTTFTIPDASDWTEYEFSLTGRAGIDWTRVKQVVFVLSDTDNAGRTGRFFLDDLALATDEPPYDPAVWNDYAFLDLVAHRAFGCFLRFTDDTGLALDRAAFSDLVSIGAVGYQLAAYCIGHRRGWADGMEARVQGVLSRLVVLPMGSEPGTTRAGYKGFFYHFLNAGTGLRKNSRVELSLYDTALLMYGILAAKECFPNNLIIQADANTLYSAVEWDWMRSAPGGPFHLAWTPEGGFAGLADGYTDEALLADVLALGSPTHPVNVDTYLARSRERGAYPEDHPETLVPSWTGSLFTYTFAAGWLYLQNRGLDRHPSDPLWVWDNNRRAVEAHRRFIVDHADDTPADGDDRYTTYGPDAWGLTACDNPVPPDSGRLSQYYAFGALPTAQHLLNLDAQAPHLGTLAVYGAGSSLPLAPSAAVIVLRHAWGITGLWSPLFGFGDAWSMDPHWFEMNSDGSPVIDPDGNLVIHPADWLATAWVGHGVLGVDEGPLLLGIENFRAGTLWELTRGSAPLKAGLDAIFGPVGDLDRDGIAGAADALLLAHYLAGNTPAGLYDDPSKGDLNADGRLTSTDLVRLLRLAGE